MKKLLFAALGLLPLLLLAPAAHAQSYTYDCLCLYSDPNGTCREYTCDAFQNSRRSYYDNDRSCGSRYDNCDYYPTTGTVYRQRYWNSSSQYYNNYSNQQYYNNSNDYNWYYNRYNTQPSYYNLPNYNTYGNNYPYYY
ncbi:MAG: hypothetical protein Q7S29_01395 [Candidatus Peribacter sp.]|nr:hypothetical protein [Candidatus Peribacter sp.]